jgi:CRP-like cAMP-binding protein
MKSSIDELSDNLFFKDLCEEEFQNVVKAIKYTNKNYDKGEIIAQEDDECNSLGFIIDGTVEIQRIYSSGKAVILKKLRCGDVFGEAIIFADQSTYPATIIASTNCNIIFIKRDEIVKLCSLNEKILRNFMSLLSNKLLMLNAKIKSISLKSTRHKVISYILEEVKKQNSLVIKLEDNKEEIAAYLGIPRPSLSRELMSLRDDEFIKFNRHTITVLKLEEIEAELFS